MNRKLSVLYITSLYPPYVIGGAEIMASFLAEYLAGEGHRITVVSTEQPARLAGSKFSRRRQNGVEVISTFPKNLYWLYEKGNPSRIQKLRWHLREAWNRDAAGRIAGILQEVRPDIVHTHNIDGFSPAVWSETGKIGIPLVHTAHDLHLICPHTTLLNKRGKVCTSPRLPCRVYRQWYLANTSHIDVFCSPSLRLLTLHREAGARAKAFCVIRNGIPVKDTVMSNLGLPPNQEALLNQEPLPNKRLLPNQEPLSKQGDGNRVRNRNLNLLFIGQLTTNKGILTLLEAFRLLPNNLPVTLNIAGKGPLEREIAEAARADSRICFHGFVSGEAKEVLYTNSDALVLPSIYDDNAPISILEAYLTGLAVIASKIGGLTELVRHNETGLLFEAGNAEILRQTFLNLLTEPMLLEKLKQGARNASKTYSAARMGEAYLKVYESLLRGRTL